MSCLHSGRHPFLLLPLVSLLLRAAAVEAIYKHGSNSGGDLHLWIDGEQVKKFGGASLICQIEEEYIAKCITFCRLFRRQYSGDRRGTCPSRYP